MNQPSAEPRSGREPFMPPDKLDDTFLLEIMKENLNQARHAENERMMFVTLFAALVGGVLAVISDLDNAFFSSVILFLLMVLNYICKELTERWNNVFKSHWATAKKISCYLSERSPQNGFSPEYEMFTETFLKQYPHLNRYFCFDNSRNHKNRKRYIHTAQLFSLFNICIFALLALSLIYVNLPALQQLF